MISENQLLDSNIQAIKGLTRLRIVTCDVRAAADQQFGMLSRLYASKNIELNVIETPFCMVCTSLR
ncbi:hypothetical protein BD414DRAFT_502877 [Trametes punicea]|nr:hypothetical protein BD414DRAFT_502877 [Trametes punicea]